MPRNLRAEGITCTSAASDEPLLDGVSLALGPGEVLCIAGRSGSGKSALLEVCAGIRQPDAGCVWWDGEPVARMGRQALSDARRGLGYVFQVHALISNLTIFDNIALPLRYHGADEQETRGRVEECLAWLGLTPVERAFPEDLAYGQMRKAALARAVVAGPDLLILDEPVSGLDPETAQEVVEAVAAYCRQRHPAVLLSGAHEGLCRALGGRAAVLAAGRLSGG